MKNSTLLLFASVLFIFCSCNNDTDNNKEEEVYVPVSVTSDWYRVGYVNPKTYVIEEPTSSQGNVSYMIIGDDKAIMFDTGSGENQYVNGTKIKHITDQLTQLPKTLLLSHFHFDHNQNIAEFSNVGFPDIPFLRQAVDVNNVYDFTSEDLFIGNFPGQVQVDEWLPIETDIDLGNRVIQLINIPGHTKESVAIIDKTNKMAFLGDYLYNGALFLFDVDDVVVYKETVNELLALLDSSYKLYGAHGTPEIPYSKLEKLSNFLTCIIDNTCQGDPTTLWGYNVEVYSFDGMQLVLFL